LDVSDASANQQIHVDVIALDDFADKRNLKKIDILKIDTEGYEPLVFRGAKRLLKEHRIRLFIFEHLQSN
jgi:FkbM family methyltransferase